MSSTNERSEIKAAIVGLLVPLKSDGTLRTVTSSSYSDYQRIMKKALAAPPFAVVCYNGKSGELMGGGLHQFDATYLLLVGGMKFTSENERAAKMDVILQAVEDKLMSVSPAAGCEALVLTRESFVAVDPVTSVEVWQQEYGCRFKKKVADAA